MRREVVVSISMAVGACVAFVAVSAFQLKQQSNQVSLEVREARIREVRSRFRLMVPPVLSLMKPEMHRGKESQEPEVPYERELRGWDGRSSANTEEQLGEACNSHDPVQEGHRELRLDMAMNNLSDRSITLRPVALLRLQDGQGRTADLRLHAVDGGLLSEYPQDLPDQVRVDAGRVTSMVYASDDVCQLPLDDRALVARLQDGLVKGTVYTIDYAGRSIASASHVAHKDESRPSPDVEALSRLLKFANGSESSAWARLYEYLR